MRQILGISGKSSNGCRDRSGGTTRDALGAATRFLPTSRRHDKIGSCRLMPHPGAAAIGLPFREETLGFGATYVREMEERPRHLPVLFAARGYPALELDGGRRSSSATGTGAPPAGRPGGPAARYSFPIAIAGLDIAHIPSPFREPAGRRHDPGSHTADWRALRKPSPLTLHAISTRFYGVLVLPSLITRAALHTCTCRPRLRARPPRLPRSSECLGKVLDYLTRSYVYVGVRDEAPHKAADRSPTDPN